MEDNRSINPGDVFRHFKNKLYQIITIALHSETGEKMVVYQALYGDYKTYVRPYDMFISEVDHIKYPEVAARYRFEKIDRNAISMEEDDCGKDSGCSLCHPECNDEVNPLLMKFFDMESSSDKIEYIRSIRTRLDDRLIGDMAASLDITLNETSTDDKIDSLLNCLKTKSRYECSRLR